MRKRFIALNGFELANMIFTGADHLKRNVQHVNALNVFPVPDGDTGTNMNMTMTSGVEELNRRQGEHAGKTAEGLAKGLLMGARGNSGVILSQLFRGFSKGIQELAEVDAHHFAAALQNGVDTAYKAVVKPVEGTILTVAREAAKQAVQTARRTNDIVEVMQETLQHAKQALARTPDQLPVLKQVGVVDAGGQGLVFIYEGFVQALSGELGAEAPYAVAPAIGTVSDMTVWHDSAQSKLSAEDIEYGYCTEFMVRLVPGKTAGLVFDESKFREEMSGFGDSLLVVADDELVKIHIHAEYPGTVMNHAMKFGDLTRIKIENMREQHANIVGDQGEHMQHVRHDLNAGATAKADAQAAPAVRSLKKYGFVAVSAGEGISDIFQSLGVDVVLSGGQTMNPSTEDIVNAVREVAAETVFVLPNNSNIVMAAQQAKEIVEENEIIVIPTKTIPQGMSAVLVFNGGANPDANREAMVKAAAQVKSGQVTYAVRDTTIDDVSIREGDMIGIMDNKIVASNSDLLETCKRLLDRMLADEGEIVTIFAGEGAADEQTEALAEYIADTYPDAEVEVHRGGQPIYSFLFSVE